MPARTRFAELVGCEEGFGLLGKIPTMRHNPGDLRHSPHSGHVGERPNDIGLIDTDEHGWEDLERQLGLYAARGLSVEQAVYEFAPPVENNSAAYLRFVCAGLGLPAGSSMADALKIPAKGVSA